METQAKAVINVGNRKLTLTSNLFNGEDDIDMDKLLRIDIRNLAAELVTFPIILNQLGLLVADTSQAANLAKLNLEIYENQIRDKIYNTEIAEDEEEELPADRKPKKAAKPKAKKKPTKDEVDAMIRMDKVWQIRKRTMFERMKEHEYVNSLFWSAKSKDEKLNKLSLTVKEGDVYDSLVDSKLRTINYVSMRLVKPMEQE